MKKSLALIAALAAISISTAADAAKDGKNRRVTVQNVSTQSVHYLYASPVTSTTWEEDLLGEGTIPSGQSKVANIDNGTTECNYDLKAKMANGREWVQRRVNVCAVSKWVIGDAGASMQ
jgi:uncharacterized low-complexity protein